MYDFFQECGSDGSTRISWSRAFSLTQMTMRKVAGRFRVQVQDCAAAAMRVNVQGRTVKV